MIQSNPITFDNRSKQWFLFVLFPLVTLLCSCLMSDDSRPSSVAKEEKADSSIAILRQEKKPSGIKGEPEKRYKGGLSQEFNMESIEYEKETERIVRPDPPPPPPNIDHRYSLGEDTEIPSYDEGFIETPSDPEDSGPVSVIKPQSPKPIIVDEPEEPEPEPEPDILSLLGKDMGRSDTVSGLPEYGRLSEQTKGRKLKTGTNPAPLKTLAVAPKLSQATVFMQQRDQITGLTFKSPRGYWANTYLPGDSLVRTLQQRLTTNQNFSMGANTPSGLELATRSGTYKQPFDSPPRAALSVFMQADKKKVDKPSRVLLQVGIQGTSRKSGQRSAMNIGVVVDMRSSFSKTKKENFKALLAELSKSHEVGDRFSLFIAGRPGGMIIPPGSFKYGPVTVALQELFSDSITNKKTRQLTITDAYLMAIEKVTAADDPTAPLGSSLVILVTPGSLSRFERQLSRIAHRSAVNGIPTSVIGLSDRVAPDQLDRIAISGQGNRRLLFTPNQAEEVIQAELSAASRVVARAVRLRIRLAPGVKLVDVLGSRALDEASSQKVRDAEKSIDRRLSINLGIDSDRGEDEDGIQIVIPSFYADDSHVILLDLVVPGAGPVADLTVRYKDLVHLKNGVSRTNLSLQRGESKIGPLEHNVLKNLLAYELSRILKQSGRLTAGNNYLEAYKQLNQFVELLKTLKQEIKGFSTDPELESDLELVMNYLLALDSARRGDLSRIKDLSDSLFYAGHLKLLGPR